MYVLNCFAFLCVVLFTEMNVLTFTVCVLFDCPSQWRGGLVYKGMDKGSFDDVTSFILRRHQKNLCLSLLTIYGPSSSSSTSSSPSTSSQRKSAFQQPANGVGWYVNQLLRRKEIAFYSGLLFLQCDMQWKCHAVWFSGKITFKPGESLWLYNVKTAWN